MRYRNCSELGAGRVGFQISVNTMQCNSQSWGLPLRGTGRPLRCSRARRSVASDRPAAATSDRLAKSTRAGAIASRPPPPLRGSPKGQARLRPAQVRSQRRACAPRVRLRRRAARCAQHERLHSVAAGVSPFIPLLFVDCRHPEGHCGQRFTLDAHPFDARLRLRFAAASALVPP